MIKPKDIEVKEFKKVAVGYSPEEVDAFLDEIYVDYERMYRENAALQKKLASVSQDTPLSATQPQPSKPTVNINEKSLERVLNMAEAAAAETKAAAIAEAERIQKEAKLRAEEVISQARARLFDMEQELADLENRYELMRTRVRLLLYAEIELLDKNEIFPEKEQKGDDGDREDEEE